MHFAAFLDVGESVREPARYYRNNVIGALTLLEAMAAESVGAFVFSSTCATYGEPIETPIVETHPQQPDQQLRRDASSPSSGRCRTSSAPTGCVSRRCATSTRPARTPTARSARITSRRFISSRGRSRPPIGGRGLEVFGDDYPTPDGTCLRDYVHVSDLALAHVRALDTIVKTGKSGAYNLGTGRPHSVREVIETVERVTGRPVPRTLGPRRPGDPAVLYAGPDKAMMELHWTPQLPDLDAIVRTAWAWHQRHPDGYRH